MAYDAGLVARIADALEHLSAEGIRQKNVFGGRGFLVGKSTFAVAWENELIVKTPPQEYKTLLERPGVAPFSPDGEVPMSTWLVVPADAIAEEPELTDWLRRGLGTIPTTNYLTPPRGSAKQ